MSTDLPGLRQIVQINKRQEEKNNNLSNIRYGEQQRRLRELKEDSN